MTAHNILITDSNFSEHGMESEILKDIGTLTMVEWREEEELRLKVKDADALLVQWAPLTERVINSLQRCKVIVRNGIGVDNIDLGAARKKGIPVCNVPDYCIGEVADHTIALALAALRQIPETDRNIRNGTWRGMLPRAVPPFSALRFNLAGFGRIARDVARRVQSLGFRVGAYDPFVAPDVMEKANVQPLSLEELLGEADVLSLHLPLNSETVHFLNRERLRLLKRTALVVNTSRGGLIDTDALAESISDGRIWGAALDVFETEPLPLEHALRNVPGVILSSHVAWHSTHSLPELRRKAAEEIRRALTGEPLLNVVNR